MPKKLINLAIPNPGIFGLNLEQQNTVLDARWAIEADNMVFDSTGRLGCRKGGQRTSTAAVAVGAVNIEQVHDYVDGGGTSTKIISTATKIYKVDGTNYTDITGSISTPTSGNWQFVNFNGKCVGFQANHAPIVMATNTSTFATVSLSGTKQPTTAVNAAAVVGGRIYVIDGTVVRASDSLLEGAWNLVAIDLKAVWLSGSDTGVAIAEFNDHLVVFGEKSVVVYQDPWDPTANTFILVENVGGVGCVARDSVQQVGSELWFLSQSGVRTLSRTIQEKSMPLRSLTKNIRLHLVDRLLAEDKSKIRSTYSEKEGFYLLSFPTNQEVWCLDVRNRLEDGSARVTRWPTSFYGLETDANGVTYMGRADGYVVTYRGYRDDKTSGAANGTVYDTTFHTGWIDFGEEAATYTKIPKRLSATVVGAASQDVVLHWAYDFKNGQNDREMLTKTLPASTGDVFGTGLFGTAVFGDTSTQTNVTQPMSRSGKVITFGVDTCIDNAVFSIQRLDVQVKIGKVSI